MDCNFVEVSFADGFAHKLNNKKISSVILTRFSKYYKLEITRAFSKYFKFIDTQEVQTLKNERHLAYYNYAGPLTYLYLNSYNGMNFCYYINAETMEIFSVKHRFSDHLYSSETLFEGKLVQTETGWTYLINDLVIYNGHTLISDLTKKLQLINEILTNDFLSDPVLDVAQIQLQDFVDYQYLQSFVSDYLTSTGHERHVAGVIFRPVNSSNTKNIILNFSTSQRLELPNSDVKKIDKPAFSKMEQSNRNICFKVKKTKTPDIYELYLTDGVDDHFYDYANVPDIKTSRTIKALFAENSKHHYIIACCKWDPRFSRWQPYRRSSRKTPDSIYVWKAVSL